MAHRSHLPKFGDWEGNTPYTAYFDKARTGRRNEKVNPSDPQGKLYVSAQNSTQHQTFVSLKEQEKKAQNRQTKTSSVALHGHHHGRLRSNDNGTEPKTRRNLEGSRSNHEQMLSRADGSQRRPIDNCLHNGAAGGRKTMQWMAGSERGIEDFQPQLNQREKVGVGGVAVPYHPGERKASSQSSNGNGFAPSTLGRPPSKSPDHGSAVPRFGDWNESNPASGEDYTGIFNRVRQERQDNATGMPVSAHRQTQLRDEKKTEVWNRYENG